MLRGSLDDFSVEDVLWLIGRTKKTGALTITRPAGRGSLFFREGLLYCADSDLMRETLDAQLVRTGLVSAAQMREAQGRATSPGTSTLRELLSLGYIHPQQLVSAFQVRLVEATFELLRREFGEFAWEANSKTEVELDAVLSVQQVLDASFAKAARLAEIHSVIPSERAVPSISKNPSPEHAAITITTEQWRLLALIDGSRSIEDIGRRERLSDFTVLTALHDLAARGLLEVGSAQTTTESATAEKTVPETARAAPAMTATKPFTIVLMCTANRIRSPLAEGFLRACLGDLPARVESVGAEGAEGQPAMPEAVEVARELGVDLSKHSARPLAAVDLSGADLILGFETRHVHRAIRDGNAPPERTFTLPQFVKCLERAELSEADDLMERAQAAVNLAHRERADGSSAAPRRYLEIVDPLGGPISAYRSTALRIRELCERVSLRVFGSPTD